MEMINIEKELQGNAYPGRGIIIGKTPDGKSYASDIADKYGLSFDKITEKISKN